MFQRSRNPNRKLRRPVHPPRMRPIHKNPPALRIDPHHGLFRSRTLRIRSAPPQPHSRFRSVSRRKVKPQPVGRPRQLLPRNVRIRQSNRLKLGSSKHGAICLMCRPRQNRLLHQQQRLLCRRWSRATWLTQIQMPRNRHLAAPRQRRQLRGVLPVAHPRNPGPLRNSIRTNGSIRERG